MKIYKYQKQTIWKYKFDYVFDPKDNPVEDIEYIGTKDDFEEFKSCEELTYKARFKNIKKTHANLIEYRAWYFTIYTRYNNENKIPN